MNADPNVTFLTTDVIRAATDAAQLHHRCHGERFTRIVFTRTLHRDRWDLRTASLVEPAKRKPSAPGVESWEGGGAIVTDIAEPPFPGLPESIAEMARERVEAAARLSELVANLPLPNGCGALSIPLRPGR